MTYIAPRSKVVRHLDRLAGWQAGRRPAPVTVEWDLSNRCTLGCQDCHFAHTHTRGPWTQKSRVLPMAFDSTGDLADLGLVLRGIDELAACGVKAIVWSGGGEPTTHPKWLDIIRHAAARGLEQGMYTLGGLLTAESAARAARCLSWVVVSLDCADGETYAREKGVPPRRFVAACDGIQHLVEARTPVVGLSFLLHRNNWQDCHRMLALARALGATYATFRPTIQTVPHQPGAICDGRAWIDPALPTLERMAVESDVEIDVDRFRAYRDWTRHGYDDCLGIRLNTTITPDGRVWLCPQRRGMADSCLGDLRVESFAELWARHPGRFAVNDGCRAMCRLHPVNQTLAALEQPRIHEAFV